MAGSLQPRVKTWVSLEDVEYDDLNAEFDNVLLAMQPLLIDDYSANQTQMQVVTDPGEVGTESLATTLAGELARLRFIIKEITGESYWYTSPSSSLAGLENVVGTGLTNNRLVSGRVRTTSQQPIFLVPNGAARTIKLDGTPTNFLYYVDGTQYTISSDVTLTNLTLAPSSNNTCLVNDAIAADQYWTKYTGEDGSEIPIDTAGTEITNLVGKFAAFKLNNGADTEYFTAFVKSSTSLTKVKRGYFFDSTDAPIPRVFYSNNDTITLMKLTWVFAQTDGTLTVSYNNPVWSDDEPTSPSTGDFWFDLSANTWKVYGVASFSTANAMLVGVCLQDTSNTVAARSFEFFDDYNDLNRVELFAESNTQVKSRFPGAQVSVWGSVIKNDHNLHIWDMTLDLESGVTEAASTYYYFYITETGDKLISDKKPHDRRADLQGHYHPSHSWRCVGWAFNNGSSNLEQVESYYHAREAEVIRSVIATDALLTRDRVILFSGASFTEYLPDAALVKGNIYRFVHNGTSLSQLYTLDAFGAQTIGGSATVIMHTNGQMLKLISDGSNWLILSSKTNTAWTITTITPDAVTTPWTKATTKQVDIFGWRRLGQHMQLQWRYQADSNVGAAAGSGIYLWGLPSGPLIDTTILPVYTGTTDDAEAAKSYCGTGNVSIDGTANARPSHMYAYSTSKLTSSHILTGTAAYNYTGSANLAANNNSYGFALQADVPIADWLP
jgi:hypothetical protein